MRLRAARPRSPRWQRACATQLRCLAPRRASCAVAPLRLTRRSPDCSAGVVELLDSKLRRFREAVLDVQVASEAALEPVLATVAAHAAAAECVATVLRRRGSGGADVLVRRRVGVQAELRVAVIGCVRAARARVREACD